MNVRVRGPLIGAVLALCCGMAAAQDVPPTSSPAASQPVEPSFEPLPAPSLNFYGSPGLIDMPTATMLPDGQYTTGISNFGGQTRFTLTFQATPWMSASFRYNGIRNWNLGGFPTYYDRGFDLRFRLFKERRRWPEITLGLQDFVGTGIYAAEYLVATKQFDTPGWSSRLPGRLMVTAGLGWGRLGSYNSFATMGDRPVFDPSGTGGEVAYDQWFRGPVAAFGGIEWRPDEKWGFKLEYSSDAYITETQVTSVFERKSPINFGVEYQATRATRLGLYYLYGSEVGVNAQIQLNPKYPANPMVIPAPQPVQPRPAREADPTAWTTGWAESRDIKVRLVDRMAPVLRELGLVMESLDVSADTAELRFRNVRYRSHTTAIGRAARVMAWALPASVETFHMVVVSRGLGLSRVTIRRSDLEALEFDEMSTDALLAVSGISNAPPISDTAIPNEELYPDFSWSLAPYFAPAYFDPAQPIRIDVGVDLTGTYQPAPGWVLSGTLRQRIAGNVADGRLAGSNLPPVRTDQVLYAQYDTTLNHLYAAKYWQPGQDLYARVTAGYFEYAYGGFSTEMLWKPVNSLLALGVELNYAIKRDYDQRLGFQDYRIFTGHASAYMDFNNGFHGQVDVGRYLAGDVGATFGLDRVFNNGWSVGGFFTLTDVSAEQFGEGSFDKGIRFRIPVGWFLGKPSRKYFGTTVRPIQRDGGARVFVPGRLYGRVRDAHRDALQSEWSGVWE